MRVDGGESSGRDRRKLFARIRKARSGPDTSYSALVIKVRGTRTSLCAINFGQSSPSLCEETAMGNPDWSEERRKGI